MTTDTRTTAAVKALRKIQSVPEVTPGTAIPTTLLNRWLGTMKNDQKPIFPAENIGIGPSVGRGYVPIKGGTINLASIEATFEESPLLAEMGIAKVATGVADGGGTGKVYEYTFWHETVAKPSQTDLGVRSFQVGGENDTQRQEFVYAETFSFEGKGSEAWMHSGTLKGRQVTPGARITAATLAFVASTKKITDSGSGLILFLTGKTIKVYGSTKNDGIYTIATGGVAGEIVVTEALQDESVGATITVMEYFDGGPTGLTTPAVEEILFGGTKVYLDPVAGSLGATQKSNTVLAAKIDVKTGIRGVPTADGTLLFSHLEFVPPEITGSLTMLWNDNAYSEYLNFLAITPRLLRIRSLGTALATAGTYTNKTLDFEGAIIWDEFPEVGEDAGLETITANFHAVYDPTAAKFFALRFVNNKATLG